MHITTKGRQDGRSGGRIDRVAFFGAALGLLGCIALPFVELRPNRIVSGVPLGVDAAGLLGWVLLALCVAALLASAGVASRRRGAATLLAGVAMVAVLLWALGSSATSLLQAAPPVARVSIGSGAWLVLLGGAVVWFAGARAAANRGLRTGVFVAAAALIGGALAWGGVGQLSLAQEFAANERRLWTLIEQHLVLSGSGLGFGTIIGVPLGILASRSSLLRTIGFAIVGVVQTIPAVAMLGLLIAPLAALGVTAIGTTPAIIALALYALLPVMRNTFVGLTEVDPGALDAGRGMGMSRSQLLLRVEIPLALPLIAEGIRAAAILVIGIAAVTAFIGAGGLGVLVFQGWGQQADDLTLLGAVPMVVLALVADGVMRRIRRLAVSPGIEEGSKP